MAKSFSGQGKSTGPYGPSVEGSHTAEQAALEQPKLDAAAAEKRQAEAAFRAARARPAVKPMTGTVAQAIDEFMGRGPAKSGNPTPTPGRNARRGR